MWRRECKLQSCYNYFEGYWEKGGGLQNCDPIDYLQISSKVLTAMQPVFFILVLTYLETILMVVVNFFAELWLSYQSHLFIL